MSRLAKNPRKKHALPMIVLGLIISLILISSSLFFLLYPFPSNEKIEFFHTAHPIIFNGQIAGEALVTDEQIYLPLDFIQKEIDPEVTFDEKSDSIIITTRNKVIQMPSESLTLFVNEEPVEVDFPALKSEDDTPYVSFQAIELYYPFQVSLLDGDRAILVRQDGETILTGKILSEKREAELRIRTKPTLTSSYVRDLVAEEIVDIEAEEEGYYFVRANDGVAGYVKKNVVSLLDPQTVIINLDEPKRFSPPISWPINLTWEAVYSKNPDTNTLPNLQGVNVVSPTWFEVNNETGDITNLGSMEYMKWAKEKNLQVWGLFSNAFDPGLTHKVLKDYETRQKMIRQLLVYSETYNLDGINIDFENVNLEDGKLLTQFVREMTPYLHEAGLIVSLDITFISSSENWSMFYERAKLADIVDYIMVMAYDEHWATSPEAGSVASFPWVEKNLQKLLEVVPNDRLILGLPTYTRIWKEQDTEGGNIEVSSKAYSMDYVKQWITEHDVNPIFDEVSGQMYGEYRDEKEKATYKVWIEDEDSLARRAQFVHQYHLAGIATWSRFFASDEAWKSMDDSLKHVKYSKSENTE
ncbi:glycosyl hydrolase family 18 protein [Bacillus salitolerans]|uniref:Glycosyl hydrolase family 18 protein n=1 Tax=Bacillus salitolerans TaxID=1437434 RepID=A0ABW4LPF0_9BACI